MIPKRNFRYGLPTSNYVDSLLGAMGQTFNFTGIHGRKRRFIEAKKDAKPSEQNHRTVRLRFVIFRGIQKHAMST